MSFSAAPFAADFHARLLARDDAAWREAFRRLWPVALTAASRIFSQNPETEDAASTALAELATHPALPATWPALEALTAVIARRRAISLLRGRHAAKRGAGETLSLEQLEYEPAAAAVAQAALDLSTLLAEVDPLRRRILEEHFIDGRTSEEIGSRLQLKPATVRSHLFRALQELRHRVRPPSP